MSKRFLLILGLLIVAGLTLASCGGSTFECDDALGCVTYEDGDPIRIASALVISGPNTDLGTDSQYGVEIAIDFQGEIMGHPIELQAEDDGCSAEGGQTAGQKIVADPSIVAVVGTSCSGAGVPMSKVVSEAGYTMILHRTLPLHLRILSYTKLATCEPLITIRSKALPWPISPTMCWA